MSNLHTVDLNAYMQKLPKGYSIIVRETPNDLWMASLSNSGAGVYVSVTDKTPADAVERAYQRWVALYRRAESDGAQ